MTYGDVDPRQANNRIIYAQTLFEHLFYNTFARMHQIFYKFILNLQGMIVFGSFGLQLLFQAAKQFITKVCNLIILAST